MSVANETKPFEFRKNDRDYQCGDYLLLKEYLPKDDRYTGDHAMCLITYVLKAPDFGVPDGYAVLGLKVLHAESLPF